MVARQMLLPPVGKGVKMVDRFALKCDFEIVNAGGDGTEAAEFAFVFSAENFWKGPGNHCFIFCWGRPLSRSAILEVVVIEIMLSGDQSGRRNQDKRPVGQRVGVPQYQGIAYAALTLVTAIFRRKRTVCPATM